MNTCGTCKYFGERYETCEWDENGDEIAINKFHVCELLKHMNGSPRHYDGPAGVVDGSGYHATFCVSEEFGCNQWTPKSS